MKRKNLGFTLTETLVAIVIGMISVVAAFSAYNYFNKSYASISQKAAISKSAREALSMIVRDLRNSGYLDPNFIGSSAEGISSWDSAQQKLIEIESKYFGNYRQGDRLNIWYTISPKDRKRITYKLKKYQNSSKDYYLSRDVKINPEGGNTSHPIVEELFVPYVEDFQVILKDKDGNILGAVCHACGAMERSYGGNKIINGKRKGHTNMLEVHTAEIYLTVRSPKEVYSKARKTKIQNGESPHGSNITINPGDKYHRETFFVSVHTRNLATPQVKIASSGQSIGVGTGYNK